MVRRAWSLLWRTLRPGAAHLASNTLAARQIIDTMTRDVHATLHGRLAWMTRWSHDQAARAMLRTLPRTYLRAAGQAKLATGQPLRESECGRLRGLSEQSQRLASDSSQRHPGAADTDLLEAGALAFGLYQPTDDATPAFDALDLAAPLRHDPDFPFGANPPSMSPEAERNLWQSLLFLPPSHDEVLGILDRILPPASWLGTVGNGTVVQTSGQLASSIASQYASGASTREVATAIRGYFDGSAVRATRTARTLGAFVGTERGFATSEALGDLVIGYQAHSAGGTNARHDHLLRSGEMYFKNPKPGQNSMQVCPHPPVDYGGPHEDGAGTKFNCRCWTAPMLRPLPAMYTPAFTDNAQKLIPDPAHFADWWTTATERQKHAATGVRRLNVARDMLQREPEWHDLVHPHTGHLLTLAELRSEGHANRLIRSTRVRNIIDRNRAAIRHVAAFGSMA